MMDERVQVWMRVFELARIDEETLAEVLKEIADSIQIAFEKMIDEVISLCRPVSEMLEEMEKCGVFDYEQTARKKKRQRERRMVAKRSNTASFRQYKAKETAWRTQKRTGARRREWRGPWKES